VESCAASPDFKRHSRCACCGRGGIAAAAAKGCLRVEVGEGEEVVMVVMVVMVMVVGGGGGGGDGGDGGFGRSET
jgi:hypothetical protein